MLKYTIVLTLLATLATAATIRTGGKNIQEEEVQEFVPIVNSAAERKSDGSFIFSYEGGDGSFREEIGLVKNAGTEDEYLEVKGTYRYIDADGQTIEVKYTAGKDGFVPEGNNIPVEISLAARAAAEASRRQLVEA